MNRTVYLHIGMPKCATTTIQDYLKDNADALHAAGIHYGFHAGDTTEGQGNSAILTSELFAQNFDRVETLLDQLLSSEGDVILSSELFLGVARGRLAEQLIDSASSEGTRYRRPPIRSRRQSPLAPGDSRTWRNPGRRSRRSAPVSAA